MASESWGGVIGTVVDVSMWILMSTMGFMLAYNALGIQPLRRGFYCDDDSIRYPYHDDTVSDGMATLICIFIPVICMVIVEAAHLYNTKFNKANGNPSLFRYIYRTLIIFLVGAATTFVLSEVMKLASGRLRPHFLTVCNPDYDRIPCSEGYIVITDDYCNGKDSKKLIDARKSFPSVHAMLAGYGMLYLLIYLEVRFIWRRMRLLLPTLQLGAVCLGCYVSISRISDNKHHVGDVVAGALIGAAGTLFTVKFRQNPFNRSSEVAKFS